MITTKNKKIVTYDEIKSYLKLNVPVIKYSNIFMVDIIGAIKILSGYQISGNEAEKLAHSFVESLISEGKLKKVQENTYNVIEEF